MFVSGLLAGFIIGVVIVICVGILLYQSLFDDRE